MPTSVRCALLSVILSIAAQAQYDLVLKGGHVIDPKNGIDRVMDVAIEENKIAAVGPEISASQSKKVVDVRGLYVTPGLVDIHTHLFYTTGAAGAWAGDESIQPDAFSFRTGVTTMVDAGSAGWRGFETFRFFVIDRAKTRVLAFINIAGLGMLTDAAEQEKSEFRPEEVARLAKKHRDVVVGVKSAHYQKPDWSSVDRAVEAGKLAGIPVMVDFGWFLPERPYWQLVTEHLRPGDITTHCFRAPVPWVDEHGKLYDYLRQARKRGVIFDVGHGGGSFVFRNAAPAVAQGFYPDSISTDLHGGSMNAGMMDMPTTMSKFLAMGEPLVEVIRESTINPAMEIQHPELGHLSVGAPADVAVWELRSGDFGFYDAAGGKLTGKQRLDCQLTVRDGKIAWDRNARAAEDYKRLGPEYGVREVDKIV
ncbi:MAG TPA: amidohydrolase/deacetylase family metallohydrolase, partial [Bryobacteraceae bacterium]|nr:amidohydrolase/deacetylase family metallohydrolase [Bryobacteraceae bacterium]